MPGPTIIEFARMADACYLASETLLPLSTRIHYGQLPSGFKGSRYRSDVGGKFAIVVSFAGTDSDDTEKTDTGDKLANIGFAGPTPGAVMIATGNVVAGLVTTVLVAMGAARLNAQINDAMELVRQAQAFAKADEEVFVTGHSLGGGLAQIVGATMGLRGVAFNAPAVSQLGYQLTDSARFVTVNIANDPVSVGTKALGRHLGEVVTIDTGDDPLDAHRQVRMVAALTAGPNKPVGDRQPF